MPRVMRMLSDYVGEYEGNENCGNLSDGGDDDPIDNEDDK